MSDSEHATTNRLTRHQPNTNIPRAVIHKQILNAAASDPDASLETIANDVSGATTALVEKVLREYGDPGSEDEDESEDTTIDEKSNETPMDETATSSSEPDPEPDASDSDIRDEPSPASTLEYPSPDADERDVDGAVTDEASDDADEALQVPDPTTLTTKQLETLRAISDQPNATQAELATRFDVTGATISQRVNSIAGFDWSERRTFIERIFELDDDGPDREKTAVSSSEATSSSSDTESESEQSNSSEPLDTNEESTNDSSSALERDETSSEGESARVCRELSEQLSALTAQVDRLERQLADRSDVRSSSSPFTDPDLAHKVAHACLRSDHISEEEELRILQEMLGLDHDHPI